MQSSIIIFTERHSAARGSDHGEFRFEFGIELEEFRHGRDHHVRRPMQARTFSAIFAAAEEPLIGDLGGGFAPAIADVEARNRCYAIGRVTQGVEGLREAKSKGANDPGGHNRDAAFGICYV
jgi:hypothetical protein